MHVYFRWKEWITPLVPMNDIISYILYYKWNFLTTTLTLTIFLLNQAPNLFCMRAMAIWFFLQNLASEFMNRFWNGPLMIIHICTYMHWAISKTHLLEYILRSEPHTGAYILLQAFMHSASVPRRCLLPQKDMSRRSNKPSALCPSTRIWVEIGVQIVMN